MVVNKNLERIAGEIEKAKEPQRARERAAAQKLAKEEADKRELERQISGYYSAIAQINSYVEQANQIEKSSERRRILRELDYQKVQAQNDYPLGYAHIKHAADAERRKKNLKITGKTLWYTVFSPISIPLKLMCIAADKSIEREKIEAAKRQEEREWEEIQKQNEDRGS